MKKALRLLAFYAYIFTFIIAGAGALNYAVTADKMFYLPFGILNILVGAYVAYKYAKGNTILY
jgi:hypothetical protein